MGKAHGWRTFPKWRLTFILTLGMPSLPFEPEYG